jgi:hypothetical protein
MKFGKTIKIFLIDGDPNGRMSCELSNWSGKAYKIPRIKIKDCTDRDDLTNTGVYLLFGKNDDDKDMVYIGESESILKRLNQHLTQKDFWNEAIIFISKDENLNKAHIKYLENRLHEIAKSANRYKLDNSIIPTQSSISESDRAEMEEFIEYIKMLVNTLGHKVFDEKTSDGFVVFKNSKASLTTVKSISPNFLVFRQKLINDGVLVNKGEYLEFIDDYIFSSPSSAAVIITGRNSNGPLEWKNSSGKSLKEFEVNE